MATLREGDLAPDFTLPAGDGTQVALSDLRGKKVVLYFYPRDNTPGCTREACAFQENLTAVKRRGAAVIGISPDAPAAHRKFAGAYGLSFPLLSDVDHRVAKLYGAWKKKSLYGRTFLGLVRTTFIIDEEGRIVRIFPKVKVDGHAAAVLESL
jgi:thioredoxin-dependent peroxiredoxin